jgi:hypothetical protein
MFKKILTGFTALFLACLTTFGQATTYDSSTLVDTNSTSTSTSTITNNNVNSGTVTNVNNTAVTSTSTNNNNNVNSSTSVNTNNNVNSGSMTNNNNNVNSGTMTYNNNNVNSGTMTNNNNNVNSNTSSSTNTNNNVNTGDMTNRNINSTTSANTNNNVNSSTNVNQNVNSGDMTNRNINSTEITQKIIQPPPTAAAPSMMSGGNADLCTTGTSGAVQTQIFGVSSGGTIRDMNCERLKLSKRLYDMGMKVAAVATMCQDRRVFDAMMAAGTPCPYDGKIGEAARAAWAQNQEQIPQLEKEEKNETIKNIGLGALLGAIVFKIF